MHITKEKISKVLRESIDNLIVESRGVPDYCLRLADEIMSKIQSEWINDREEKPKMFEVRAPFASYGIILVYLVKMESVLASYLFDWKQTNGYTCILINSNRLNMIKKTTIVHELIHAYEDCMRKLKKPWKEGIKSTIEPESYKKVVGYRSKDNKLTRNGMMAMIARLSAPMEMRAHLGCLSSEEYNQEDIKQAKQYKVYQVVLDHINYFLNCGESMNEDNLRIANEFFGNKFRTYQQFENYLRLTKSRIENAMKKAVMRTYREKE